MKKASFIYLALFISATCLNQTPTNGLNCLNHKGEKVEWVSALRLQGTKFPRKYAVIYPGKSDFEEVTEEELIGTIFKQVDMKKHLVSLWNDGHPYEKSKSFSNFAHSKGVIAYDKNSETGFYITHSIPWFPFYENDVLEPFSDTHDNKSVYAQTFLCLPFTTKATMEKFYYHINMIRPNLYYDTLADEFTKGSYSNPELQSLSYASGKINVLIKPNGSNTHMFPDLFAEYWAPRGVNKGFKLRTWGRKYCTSICTVGERRMSVIGEVKWRDYVWRGSQEHGKWVMSENSNVVCIGDLNYMSSQETRGGAFVCINDDKLHAAFKNIVLWSDCDMPGCSQVALS